MHSMCTIPGPYFNGFLGTETRPHKEEIEIKERLLMCKHAKTIVHKRQIDLHALSPYSTLHYLTTENITEKKEHTDVKKEDNNRILRTKR